MMNCIQQSVFIVVAWWVGALATYAWGPEGHMIVGRIAEQQLTPRTALEVQALLNTAPTSPLVTMANFNIVNWADEIRPTHPETAPWHFVDIPFDATHYAPERDCHAPEGCIITAIEKFRLQLADLHTNRATRTEALKYLIHFVGDIHVPLHCAERYGDKGGNMVWVREPNDVKATRLHAFWDETLVEKNIKNRRMDVMAYADSLNRAISATQAKAWCTGNPANWAWEAHLLAVKEVYAGIPVHGKAVTLDAAYITRSQRIVAEQLSKAGLRLAQVLNEVCDRPNP